MVYTNDVMQRTAIYRKCIVTAFCGMLMSIGLTAAALAQDAASPAEIDKWLSELADPANSNWQRAEADLQREWSRSGSPALDLLLKRGEDAMAAGDYDAAIGHLTALTDQAPGFAEGWNARATAYYLAGLFGPSVADIERTLALNPRHYGALSGLGLILQEMGRKEKAREAFEASLAINPHQENIRKALDQLKEELAGTEL